MKSYYIHFIRHGAISQTLKGRYIGVTDAPLSAEGEKELRRLDRELDYPYAKVVFTSPLKRCTKTAEILYPHIKPLVIDQLSECHFGEWENKTADELKSDDDFKEYMRLMRQHNWLKPKRYIPADAFFLQLHQQPAARPVDYNDGERSNLLTKEFSSHHRAATLF